MSHTDRTHTICVPCYRAKHPGVPAVQLRDDRVLEPCCYCGTATSAGIYYRDDFPQAFCSAEIRLPTMDEITEQAIAATKAAGCTCAVRVVHADHDDIEDRLRLAAILMQHENHCWWLNRTSAQYN